MNDGCIAEANVYRRHAVYALERVVQRALAPGSCLLRARLHIGFVDLHDVGARAEQIADLLTDGGALAFFQFENPKDQEEFGPKMPASPFHHIALAVNAETQAAIEKRIAAAGIKPPHTYVLEHGYCRSVYITDPNGLILEFTLDHPEADKISRDRRDDAHRELKRWLEGNHKSNNTYR